MLKSKNQFRAKLVEVLTNCAIFNLNSKVDFTDVLDEKFDFHFVTDFDYPNYNAIGKRRIEIISSNSLIDELPKTIYIDYLDNIRSSIEQLIDDIEENICRLNEFKSVQIENEFNNLLLINEFAK